MLSHRDAHELNWYHVELWCYGQWLPGDSRGFRSRGHKVHSSGDYKNPPPPDEHKFLHQHAQHRLKHPPRSLSKIQRRIVGELCVKWTQMKSLPLLAICVGRMHSHLFVGLAGKNIEATVGKLKRYVSMQAGRKDSTLAGQLFAASGEPRRVSSVSHAKQLMPYITEKHALEGAWIWSDEASYAKLILGWS